MERKSLVRALLIMLATVAVTVGLSFALNKVTGPRIEKNKQQASVGALIEVMPNAKGFEDITATLTIDPASGVTEVYAETEGQGYVVKITKNGYSKPVNVVLGVDASGLITGVKAEIGVGDYGVGNMPESFIGQDSTLSGVQLHAGATTSSNTVKAAVEAGFNVLASNNLMKAAVKTPEQVFEELLPTVLKGFVKGADVQGNDTIKTAYTSKNGAALVCYVTKGETQLLTITNVSGATKVYKANCLDENTQTYELEEVTTENSEVVAEVVTFAEGKVTSTFTKLSEKITRDFEGASDITEVTVTTFGSVTSALSFTLEGQTYYAYYAKPVNGFENDVMDVYVVLDSEGKIVKTDVVTYFYGHGVEYLGFYNTHNEGQYEGAFVGQGNTSFDSIIIAGATFTTNAIKQGVDDAFAEFAEGGNN